MVRMDVAPRRRSPHPGARHTRRPAMRRSFTWVAALGAVTLGATLSAQAAAKPKEVWASGQILRLNQADHTIVLKEGTREVTFALASDAHVMQGAKTLAATDLASDIGHRARVRYTTANGKKTADRIEVTAAAP